MQATNYEFARRMIGTMATMLLATEVGEMLAFAESVERGEVQAPWLADDPTALAEEIALLRAAVAFRVAAEQSAPTIVQTVRALRASLKAGKPPAPPDNVIDIGPARWRALAGKRA